MTDTDLKLHERMIKARFYRWMLHHYGGHWKKAAEAVAAVTGVKIRHETLRQNIQPVSQKAGEPPRRFQKLQHLKALKDFLVSVNYLYEQELDKGGESGLVALAVSDFLNGEGNPPDALDLTKFRGRFIGERSTSGYRERLELHIDYLSADRPVRVTGQTRLHDKGLIESVDSFELAGWFVANRWGFYLLLLKEAYGAKCLLVLQTAPSISSQEPVNDMAVLVYESAWEGALDKTVTTVDEGVETTDYHWRKNLDDLRLFLTRA